MIVNISVTDSQKVYFVDVLAKGGRVVGKRILNHSTREEVDDRRGYWFYYNQTRLHVHLPLGNGWHEKTRSN